MSQQLNLISKVPAVYSANIIETSIPVSGTAYQGPLYYSYERPELLSSQINSSYISARVIGFENELSRYNCYHITDLSSANIPIFFDVTGDYLTANEIELLSKTLSSALDVTGKNPPNLSNFIEPQFDVTLALKNDCTQHINYGYKSNTVKSLFKINTDYTFTNPTLYYRTAFLASAYSVKNNLTNYIKNWYRYPLGVYLTTSYNSIYAERELTIYPVKEVVQTSASSYSGHPRVYWKFNLPQLNGNVAYAYLKFHSNTGSNSTSSLPLEPYTSTNSNWVNNVSTFGYQGSFNNTTETQSFQNGQIQILPNPDGWATVDVLGYPNHTSDNYSSVKGVHWHYDTSSYDLTIILEAQWGTPDNEWTDPSSFVQNNGTTFTIGETIYNNLIDGMNSSSTVKPRIIIGYNSPIINVTPTDFIKTVTSSDTTTSDDTFTVTNDGAGQLNFSISGVTAPWIDSVVADTTGPLLNGESATVTINYDLSAGYSGGYSNTTQFLINSPEANIVVVPINATLNVLSHPQFIYNGDSTSQVFITLDKNPAVTNPTTTFSVYHGDPDTTSAGTPYRHSWGLYFSPPSENDPEGGFTERFPVIADATGYGTYDANYLDITFTTSTLTDHSVTDHIMDYDITDLVTGETYIRNLTLINERLFAGLRLYDLLIFNIEVIDTTVVEPPPPPKRKNSGTYSNYLI